MTTDKEQYDIAEKYGLPRKHVSCPACGQVYGAYGRKVCNNCQECSQCCFCKDKKMIDADDFVRDLIDHL
jgi:hypothetical protein